MIEEIKGIRTELHVDRLRNLSVLDQRQIEVRESGTVENITAQIAETVRGGDAKRRHGIGDPLGGVPANLHWGNEIRTDRVASARGARRGENDVERIAALHYHDRRQFPPTDKAITFERQFVDGIRDKSMPRVEIGIPAAVEDVRAVLNNDSRVVAGNLVDGV